MATRLRGRWALGIVPRNFTWILKDKLAICERPGGYGENHRRVRRQEEIIWIRENGFGCVISIIPAPHNLHNYDEMGMPWRHRPFTRSGDQEAYLSRLFPELRQLTLEGGKLVLHQDELGDRLSDRLDTRVKVALGRSKGKISIEFASLSDLERIVAVIDPRNRDDRPI